MSNKKDKNNKGRWTQLEKDKVISALRTLITRNEGTECIYTFISSQVQTRYEGQCYDYIRHAKKKVEITKNYNSTDLVVYNLFRQLDGNSVATSNHNGHSSDDDHSKGKATRTNAAPQDNLSTKKISLSNNVSNSVEEDETKINDSELFTYYDKDNKKMLLNCKDTVLYMINIDITKLMP